MILKICFKVFQAEGESGVSVNQEAIGDNN